MHYGTHGTMPPIHSNHDLFYMLPNDHINRFGPVTHWKCTLHPKLINHDFNTLHISINRSGPSPPHGDLLCLQVGFGNNLGDVALRVGPMGNSRVHYCAQWLQDWNYGLRLREHSREVVAGGQRHCETGLWEGMLLRQI